MNGDNGAGATILETRSLTIKYGSHAAVKEACLKVPRNEVTAIIGPSGCGKSTLLRAFNRMNDFIADARFSGEVLFQGRNIYDPSVDPVEVRRRIGMVFQKPNPFPKQHQRACRIVA